MSLASTSIPAYSTALVIPANATTHAGFRAWASSPAFPAEGRIAFIRRQIHIDMSPEELETHNRLKMEICRVIGNLMHERRGGYLYGDRTLLTNEAAELSTEPDAVYVSARRFKSRQVVAVPRREFPGEYIELTGSPDWVLEVVSRGSVQKDSVLLRAAYHSAKVPEYWLVSAIDEQINFCVLRWTKDGYAETPARQGWVRSRAFSCEFRLRRRRDALSFWRYTLEVRAK